MRVAARRGRWASRELARHHGIADCGEVMLVMEG